MKVLLGVQGELGCCAPRRKSLCPAPGVDARPNPRFGQQLGAASMMGRGSILPRAERQVCHRPWYHRHDQGGANSFLSSHLPAARGAARAAQWHGTGRKSIPHPRGVRAEPRSNPALLQLIAAIKIKVEGSAGAPL